MTENAIILYYSPTQLSCRGGPHHLEAKHSELVMTPPTLLIKKMKRKKKQGVEVHPFIWMENITNIFVFFIYLPATTEIFLPLYRSTNKSIVSLKALGSSKRVVMSWNMIPVIGTKLNYQQQKQKTTHYL
jgi:hypothetical protein